MLLIIKKLSIGLFILSIIPIIIYYKNWKWSPKKYFLFKKYIYYITITGSYPFCIIPFLIIFISFIINNNLKNKEILLLIFLVIFLGQILKKFIKNLLKINRPIINWINKKIFYIENIYYFSKKNKKKIILNIFNKYEKIPLWLKNYWINESGFSFPSGHAIFSSTLSLFSIIILWPKHINILIFIMLWAEFVMLSRIALGMHFAEDIFVGTLISYFLIIFLIFLLKIF